MGKIVIKFFRFPAASCGVVQFALGAALIAYQFFSHGPVARRLVDPGAIVPAATPILTLALAAP